MPAFRYYYLQNKSSVFVQATITPEGGETLRISAPIAPGSSARIDLTPFSSEELHNLGLGVASTSGGHSASAGSFFTFEPRLNITLYNIASGDKDGLSIEFDGYGPDPAPPSKATEEKKY